LSDPGGRSAFDDRIAVGIVAVVSQIDADVDERRRAVPLRGCGGGASRPCDIVHSHDRRAFY
jgi:hypothetical protein